MLKIVNINKVIDISIIFTSIKFDMKQSNQTVFYLIEKAIKEYRKHCLRNIKAKIKDLTVDQTMLIFMIQNEPDLNQKELASILFKDTASITLSLIHI